MITREQYLNSIQQEINLCKHLYTKITPDKLNYRPTPGQRSVLELLQYLSSCSLIFLNGALSGDWQRVREDAEKTKQMKAEDFCAALDRQMAGIKKIIQGFSEADFTTKEVALPIGPKVILGQLLIDFALKFLTAYRMQLFLYLKESGLSELTTYNCWMGIDKPPDAMMP